MCQTCNTFSMNTTVTFAFYISEWHIKAHTVSSQKTFKHRDTFCRSMGLGQTATSDSLDILTSCWFSSLYIFSISVYLSTFSSSSIKKLNSFIGAVIQLFLMFFTKCTKSYKKNTLSLICQGNEVSVLNSLKKAWFTVYHYE